VDGVTLVAVARGAGLVIQAAGDRLVIQGPRRLGSVAQLLLAHKPAVLSALATEDVATAMWHVPCVDCGAELPRGYWYRCAPCLAAARGLPQ
jgi:hypothetical protein